jgi:5-hydroxyisourate hydrolase
MSHISTHVLDTSRGMPASEVPVRLDRRDAAGHWHFLASGNTDREGRCRQLLPEGETLRAGHYRLTLDTASYYARHKVDGLYPFVEITFAVREGETDFHIPLLLSPYGYTTYRGT